MARRARLVIPGLPHYIQQKGYDESPLFFSKSDGETYQRILKTCCASAGLQILGYCFMPDEIHLLAVPQNKESLRKGIGDSSRQYARFINESGKMPPENDGTLWADRFHSCPLQDKYTHHALHLIEWTPVLAGEVKVPYHWHYSSARIREQGEFDDLLSLHPLLKHVDWQALRAKKPSYLQMDLIYSHINTGRPLGDEAFIASLEQKLGKRLRPRKRGRRPAAPSLSEAHNAAASFSII